MCVFVTNNTITVCLTNIQKDALSFFFRILFCFVLFCFFDRRFTNQLYGLPKVLAVNDFNHPSGVYVPQCTEHVFDDVWCLFISGRP